MMMLFSFLAMNVRYWLDTEGVMYLFWLLFVLASFVGLVFYHYAFYLTMRDNLPRMVKTKNSVWCAERYRVLVRFVSTLTISFVARLFLFTLYYFEIAVLAGLFWFLYIVLSLSGTALCRGLLCQGNISAVIFFANSTTAVLTYVLIRSRKLLGIPLLDAFGI